MDYKDIIDYEYKGPKNHVRMPIEKRAAQFSPFAALSGYSESLKETERLTFEKKELSDSDKEVINNKLQIINSNLKNNMTCEITYYVKDMYKSGGNYIIKNGEIRVIDLPNKKIIFKDKTKINIDDIVDVKIEDNMT